MIAERRVRLGLALAKIGEWLQRDDDRARVAAAYNNADAAVWLTRDGDDRLLFFLDPAEDAARVRRVEGVLRRGVELGAGVDLRGGVRLRRGVGVELRVGVDLRGRARDASRCANQPGLRVLFVHKSRVPKEVE